MNRYHVLYYQEQTQLFLFNGFYFQTYWNQPGGIMQYIGSFFTQFNYYPFVGACIYAAAIGFIWLLTNTIWKYYKMERWYFVTSIPAICMLFANIDLNFRLSYTLCLLAVLVVFRLYLSLPSHYRFIAAIILLLILYLTAGGSMFLLAFLIWFDICLSSRTGKRPILILTVKSIALILICLLIPHLSGQFLYVATLEETYLAHSPFALIFPNHFYKAAWIAIPFLLIASTGLGKLFGIGKKQTWISTTINTLLIVGMVAFGVFSVYSKQADLTIKMSYELDREEWSKVLEDSPKALPSELSSYFTDIALYETGALANRMFHYAQVGPTGLLLGHKNGYFNRYCMGNLMYRLGLIAEAKHCAFEALVGNTNFKEPNAQTLQYLVTTSILQRNTADFNKYIRYFEQSLFYRPWAKQQKQRMEQVVADPDLQIPQLVKPANNDDFFINYKHPEDALIRLLEKEPNHQMAFEYLMAFYMLQMDFEATKQCFDRYYANFNYPKIPVHYEEFLALYRHLNKDAFFSYPVSKEMIDRFDMMYLLLTAPQSTDEEIKTLLKSRYGNTYWYYITFPLALTHKTSEYETKTIY
jgi:hypothetical protein